MMIDKGQQWIEVTTVKETLANRQSFIPGLIDVPHEKTDFEFHIYKNMVQIFKNGKELRNVRAGKIEFGANSLTEVTLTFLPIRMDSEE